LSVARNTGAKSTDAKILAYLDDDAEASTQWLRVLLEIYDNNSQLAIAGGKVELKLPANYEKLPSWISENLSGALGFYNLGNEIIYITEPGLTPRGLNYSIKRDFLEIIGGFDANFGRVGTRLISNEELVMTELALEKDRQVAYIPEALVLHNVQSERLKPEWFLRRSWWQGVSEYYRDESKKSSKTSLLAKGGERFLRGLYKSIKNINQPDICFDNLLYAYGQLGYFSSIFQINNQ
jgi:glycosyltransferase involved in cell wall biosynthesis